MAETIPAKGPDHATVTILEFSDFQCPFSAQAQPIIAALLRQHSDKVQLIFKHTPLPIHPEAAQAHEAALAAGEQGKFWEMHDLLFRSQGRIDAPTLVRYAMRLGLELKQFRQQLEQHEFKSIVMRDLAEARALGVESTPTFFVNGKKVEGVLELRAAVDLAFNNVSTIVPRAGHQSSLRDVSVEGAPFRGLANAPVTIVEFTDLQCPFCARALPTLQQVLRDYPISVKWVLKHYPLESHEDSMLAHQAILAAGQQGKLWELHDAIFGNQQAMKRDDLVRMASGLGLDMPRFVHDMDDPQLKERVLSDKAEGTRLGVEGTPTFFIDGRAFVGVPAMSEFRSAIKTASGGSAQVPGSSSDPAKQKPHSGQGAIEVIWFSDVTSPLSSKALLLMKQLSAEFPDRLQIDIKHKPLENRADALLAHRGLAAARVQGKLWEMHEALLTSHIPINTENLVQKAIEVGMDGRRFKNDLTSEATLRAVDNDLADARRRDVRGVPVFFVNQERVDGIQPLGLFEALVETELKDALTK